MVMDQMHKNGAESRVALSPALPELLNIIGSATNSTGNDTSLMDDLVAFRKKSHAPLAIADLTIAFRECFLTFDESTLLLKLFIVDWLSDLVKNSTHATAPTCVIIELSKVSAQLNVNRQTEEWMPLLTSLCSLTDSCLGAVRRLDQGAMGAFLEGSGSMSLATIVLDTGMRVFNHVDRNHARKARSEGYLSWNQSTLNLTKNFQEFLGDQVQQNKELQEHARDMTISVCNMLLRYAEVARCEYAYLNIAFKCIIALVPNCKEDRVIRLETQNAIRLLCDGILGSFMDIYRTCVDAAEVNETYISRRWTLSKFYMAHLRSLASSLFKDICRTCNDTATSRGLIRYLLFFMRGRFITSEAIKKNHPQIHSEIVKAVGIVEDIVVSAMFTAANASERDKHALIHEFSMAPGPRAAFNVEEPLSEYEWEVGRLKFLLKTFAIFDEFSPALQLQLYPSKRIAPQDSLLDRLVDCVETIDMREFVPKAESKSGQESSDLYFRILTELCSFTYLVQPSQFKRLQIDMIGLVLDRSELWSLLARDWWVCVAHRLGPVFTKSQTTVFVELLVTLPVGTASAKISSLIGSMIKSLDEESQLAMAENVLAMTDQLSNQNLHTLLSCFPYDSLSICNLESLITRCTNEWRDACSLMEDEHLAVDALYAMHPHVACLASILSKIKGQRALSNDIRQLLTCWSVVIVSEAHWLLGLVQDDTRSLSKISRTIEDIVRFLQSIQPLQCDDLIKVLDAIASWEGLPLESRPLSRVSIARFLASCGAMEVMDESHMSRMKDLLSAIYNALLYDTDWIVKHATLMSLAMFKKSTHYPQLVEALAEQEDETALSDMTGDAQSLWAMMDGRAKALRHQRFDNHTVSDLQAISASQPSAYACMSALSTIEQYMKALSCAPVDDDELRSRIADMLDRALAKAKGPMALAERNT